MTSSSIMRICPVELISLIMVISLCCALPTSDDSPHSDKDNKVEISHENKTSEISSEKYNVSLKCIPGQIVLNFNFAESFRGAVVAGRDSDSDCRLTGDGKKQYVMKIPLQKCGTLEDPERTFTNTIMLRYHPVLEIGGDEMKTIVCKYGKVRFVFGNADVNEK